MKLTKMLSLSVLVVVAGAVWTSVPRALANSEHIALCEKAELECKKAFPSPTTIVAHATKPALLSSVGTVECEKSLAELSLLSNAGESNLGHLSGLSFEGNCHLGGTSCTVTVGSLGLLTFAKSGALTANATSNGGTETTVKCGFFINCTYGGEPVLNASSTTEGVTTLTANETELIKSKGICPKVSEWDATYTALGSMWIESPLVLVEEKEITLCEQPELECKEPFESGTIVVAHAHAPKLVSSSGTVECEKSLAELSLLNEPAELIIGHLLALSFEGNCHLGETSCTTTAESLGLFSFTKTGPLEALSKSTGGTQLRLKCASLIDCKYSGEPALEALSSEGGETRLIANKVVLTEGKGANCPKTSEWDATYTALGSMWIESPVAAVVEKEIVLCEKAELECQSPFPNPTMIVGHATSPKLLSSVGTVECEKSLAELSLLNANSESIIGHLMGLSFEGNCHLGGTSCSVTVGPLGLLTFAKSGALTATATSNGGTEANVHCGIFINCTYGGEPTLNASSSAEGLTTLTANETELVKSKGICPKVSEWDATYTALGSMWIESPGAGVPDETSIVLCKKTELPCEDSWPNPTTLVGHAEGPKILTNLGTMECAKSLMEFTVLNQLSTSMLAHLLSLSLEGSCHLGETGCTVTVESLGLVSLTKTGALAAAAKSTGGTEFTVKCGSTINCTYGGEPTVNVVSTEGGTVTLSASGVPLKTIKGSACPKESFLDASYTMLGTMWIES